MFNFTFDTDLPNLFLQPAISEEPDKDLLNPLDEILEKFNFEDFPTLKFQKRETSWIFQLPSDANFEADCNKFMNPADENCEADHTTEATSFAHSPQLSSPMGETTAQQDFDYSSKEAESTEEPENIQEFFQDFFSQVTDSYSLIKKIISAENGRLRYAITQVLEGIKPTESDLESLTLIERSIIEAIMDKKKLNQDSKKKKKREEEKQKFFFKGVLKYTEQKFFEDIIQSKKKIRRKQLERSAYYDFYWGETAKQSGLDISNFYHPNRRINAGKTTAQINSAQNPGLKSLNTTYVELILGSARFRAATKYYMDEVFMQEALKSRPKKIGKMLEKLQAVALQAANKSAGMSETAQNEFVAQTLKDYITKNAKCKLPWSNTELRDARINAEGTLNRIAMLAQYESVY